MVGNSEGNELVGRFRTW